MSFHANAKLMLFGEYLVLKGSRCLAIPLKFNQKGKVSQNKTGQYQWRSFEFGKEWFSAVFDQQLSLINSSDQSKAETLQQILKVIHDEKPVLFQKGWDFEIHSNFPKEWGLGSSSSLISILAQWASMDPYKLLEKTFGGSGYDIACATAEKPILYETKESKVQEVNLSENITSQLLFVYSGKKQSSQNEINRFKNFEISTATIEKMNSLISAAINSKEMDEFESCMEESEQLISDCIQKEKIKTEYFKDYPFSIKSLGAWGGDFFMAGFRDENKARQYFNEKGFPTHFTYSQLIYTNDQKTANA